MRRTYFLDIDGTLLEQLPLETSLYEVSQVKALPEVKNKTMKWHLEGHCIVLTTARCESFREITIQHLRNAGIPYDHLIMGLGHGPRILVNDRESSDRVKAYAYNVLRNIDGLKYIP